MGIKDWLKKLGSTEADINPVVPLAEVSVPVTPVVELPVVEPKVKKPRKKKEKKVKEEPPANAEKEAATAKGEPWVGVLGIEIDTDNVGTGAFILDWNDKFVAKLVRAGFRGKTDQDIVDQWFTSLCRSIIKEEFEQEMADPTNRTRE